MWAYHDMYSIWERKGILYNNNQFCEMCQEEWKKK